MLEYVLLRCIYIFGVRCFFKFKLYLMFYCGKVDVVLVFGLKVMINIFIDVDY